MFVLRAYRELIRMEHCIRSNDLQAIYDRIRSQAIQRKTGDDALRARICADVDLACVWYWKPVLCLQRSVVTALLLRRHGVEAKLVFGVQQTPFRAHAWVEVEGHIVNDKAYLPTMYTILDRIG